MDSCDNSGRSSYIGVRTDIDNQQLSVGSDGLYKQ